MRNSMIENMILPVIVLIAVFALLKNHFISQNIDELQVQVNDLKNKLEYIERKKSNEGRNLEHTGSACTCKEGYTYASDFGLKGDSVTDDTAALQASIDSAANGQNAGGIVVLPSGTFLTTSPITIPAGVTIQGQGYGSSPLAIQFDAGSSIIAYCGRDFAVKISGSGASLQNLAIYDWRYPLGSYCDTVAAAGGILIEANNTAVESVTMWKVLIYWFMGGTSLTINAKNAGGIAYCHFQDLRIRHAQRGIFLSAETDSFVNSNTFFGGAISGGIEQVGIQADSIGPCNDNKFYSMVIEPFKTDLAHVVVNGSKTNLKLIDVRLEGTEMLEKPLVIIDDSSYDNVITGLVGHTNIKADFNRNPRIDITSSKFVGLDPAPRNMFWNSAFHGYDTTDDTMPGWSVSGSNRVISYLPESEVIYADHKVIHIDYLNFGGSFNLKADFLPRTDAHAFVTFGVYARSSIADCIVAAMRYESGDIISSASNSGQEGVWEFIGMSALYDRSNPYFYFSISGDVDLTAPILIYGQTSAIPGASFMLSSGAKMSGTFTQGYVKAYPPTDSSPFWILPKDQGNIFQMEIDDGKSLTIIRINDVGEDRFSKGTVITLLFKNAGTTVKHSAYINLLKGEDFVSSVNSALVLLSNGDPTWIEISRSSFSNVPYLASVSPSKFLTSYPKIEPSMIPSISKQPIKRESQSPSVYDRWKIDFDKASLLQSSESNILGGLHLYYNISKGKSVNQINLRVFDEICQNFIKENIVLIDLVDIFRIQEEELDTVMVSVSFNTTSIENSVLWHKKSNFSGLFSFCLRADLALDDVSNVSVSFVKTRFYSEVDFKVKLSESTLDDIILSEMSVLKVEDDNKFEISACVCKKFVDSYFCENDPTLHQNSKFTLCLYPPQSLKILKVESVIFYQDGIAKYVAVENGILSSLSTLTLEPMGVLETRLISIFFDKLDPLPVTIHGSVVLSFSNQRLLLDKAIDMIQPNISSSSEKVSFFLTLSLENNKMSFIQLISLFPYLIVVLLLCARYQRSYHQYQKVRQEGQM